MRKLVPAGTPSRTNRYIYPRRRIRPFAVSLGVALGLAILLGIGALSGARSIASPGPVATAHATFEKACASCHAPRVADVRCEHCHDPVGTGRYQNAGHVWFGTKNPAEVQKAAALDCARCHTDHRGRRFDMSPMDDRQCRSCHFAALSKHPEFALVKAGAQRDEGMQLSHKKHLKLVQKAKLDECQYCHEPTRDRRSFQPLNFDQHCGKCHLPGGFIGATDPIPAEAVVLPQDIDAPWARSRGRSALDSQGRVIIPKLMHKDPWILFNVWKIAREVDPAGAAARRGEVERRIADLTAELAMQQRPPVSKASLQEEEARLVREAASPRTSSAGRTRADRALARVRVEIELGPAPLAVIRPRARTHVEAVLRQLQAELANLTAGGTPAALTAEQRQARLAALTAITAPCALCHVYDGPWMKPVQAGVPMLTRANYNHHPHLQQMACQACHLQIAESKKAEDVNLPGVQSCQGCHRPGRSRNDCAECHTYHPPSEPWPPI